MPALERTMQFPPPNLKQAGRADPKCRFHPPPGQRQGNGQSALENGGQPRSGLPFYLTEASVRPSKEPARDMDGVAGKNLAIQAGIGNGFDAVNGFTAAIGPGQFDLFFVGEICEISCRLNRVEARTVDKLRLTCP